MVMAVPALFAHIPKTAGTTFYRIFADHVDCRKIFPFYFPEEKWNLRNSDNFDLFFTHITKMLRSGVFVRSGINFFTCLRDPRYLVSSLYNHILRESKDPNLEFLEALGGVDWYRELPDKFSITELIDKNFLSPNLQVNWLANCLGGAAVEEDFSEIAKSFLNSTKWFGIVERFDLSYSLLCAVNSWRPVQGLERENVGLTSASPEGLQTSITTYFAGDLELYDFANKLLDERAALFVEKSFNSKTRHEFASENITSLTEKLTRIAEQRYTELKGAETSTEPSPGVLMAEFPFDGSGWHRREYDFKTRPYRWNGAAERCDIDLPCLFTGGGQIFLTLVAWNPAINFSHVRYSINGLECTSSWSYFEEDKKTKIIVRIKVPKLQLNPFFKFSRLVISDFVVQKLSSFAPETKDDRSVGFAFQDIYYLCN
jgi:hypothetical protein